MELANRQTKDPATAFLESANLDLTDPTDNDDEWMCLTPAERFIDAAIEAGLICDGQTLNQKTLVFCRYIVEMAASLGDPYPVRDGPPSTVGGLIRQVLGQ